MFSRSSLRQLAYVALVVVAVAAFVLATAEPAWTDDRDLLRFNTGKPYLFILLDTSASMNLTFGQDPDTNDPMPAVGHGDDPNSKLYAAKEGLFSVFRNVDDVHFGFASFNQDRLHVRSKHWLYFVESVPSEWPFKELEWPRPDPDGLTTDLLTVDTDGDGTPDAGDGFPDNDVEGDVLVFGPSFRDASGNPVLEAGSCDTTLGPGPLDLDDLRGRRRVNAFAREASGSSTTTTIWVERRNTVYRLTFRRLGPPDGNDSNPGIGSDKVQVRFGVTEFASDCSPAAGGVSATVDFTLRLDPGMDDFLMVDRGVPGSNSGNNAEEWTAALWPWADARDAATCGSGHPFTGKGWEGNYDAGITLADQDFPDEGVDKDRFCTRDSDGDLECIALKPMEATSLSSFGRAMDRGDVLPFDWTDDNRVAFLQRLAPNWPEEVPDFGITHHLDRDSGTGLYEPRIEEREPLIARGDTPLAKALNDVRCWYMGTKGSGGTQKCGEAAFFDAGWSDVACTFDSEYGCRKPFFIMITDGDDTCAGENPGADVSDMKSFTGVQTWALNLGDPRNCKNGALHSITNRADGQCINIANKQQLKDALRDILGEVREQARAFASAAVPSVQATADQALYISNFTPLNGRAKWDGHLNAFLKPLPVTDEGTPDTSVKCSATRTSQCHLWDAAEVLKTEQHDASDPNGLGTSQRRVLFGRERDEGVPRDRAYLDETAIDCSGCGNESGTPPASCQTACFDLLEGLDIFPVNPTQGQLNNAEKRAETIMAETLSVKSHTLTNPDGTAGDTITYLLGDIFHSNPTVVGTPVNTQYFALDAGSNQDEACVTDSSSAAANRGYRCFLERHRFRRKTILVGSNDGMLHAFNAGFFDSSEGRYDNGTGHELWSLMPRGVMPRVRQIAEGSTHKFTVDGTPAVADVFIDPVHTGSPTEAERLWRTVAVAGLREGGEGYFAVDITQPDRINEVDGEFIPDEGGNFVPACFTEPGSTPPAGCGPVPYPSMLWEFEDRTSDSLLNDPSTAPDPPVRLDEDGNGHPDLGETWSVPNIGRIQLCSAGGSACNPNDPANSGDLEDVYVAVFAGGMDPDHKADPKRGDWLYMVDIETGKLIYKRRLLNPSGTGTGGSAPGDVAAVDTDQDSYLDRIYVGTTLGYMHRVDLLPASSGNMPELETTSVQGIDGFFYDVKRVPEGSALDPIWQPRVVFDANFTNSGASVDPSTRRRPIYHGPAVIFVARLGLFGLAFGTGDREDLWNQDLQEGRFYVFVDDTDPLAAGLGVDPQDLRPRNEGDFLRIDLDDPQLNQDLLLTRAQGEKGWFLSLNEDERVITEAFSLSGVTFFSSFQPDVAVTDEGCDPQTDPNCEEVTGTCGDKSFEADTDNRCAKTGFSRLFVVGTVNGNAFLSDGNGGQSRFSVISTFVTNPFTEPGTNPNETSGEGGNGSNEPTSDDLTVDEQEVMRALMSLFPPNCKFANYRIDIKTIAADTRVARIAPVPVCIVEKNWKEF